MNLKAYEKFSSKFFCCFCQVTHLNCLLCKAIQIVQMKMEKTNSEKNVHRCNVTFLFIAGRKAYLLFTKCTFKGKYTLNTFQKIRQGPHELLTLPIQLACVSCVFLSWYTPKTDLIANKTRLTEGGVHEYG